MQLFVLSEYSSKVCVPKEDCAQAEADVEERGFKRDLSFPFFHFHFTSTKVETREAYCQRAEGGGDELLFASESGVDFGQRRNTSRLEAFIARRPHSDEHEWIKG